jgi:hypothetical protein
VILQPGAQSIDNRATSLLANRSSMFGGLATDLGFGGVKFADLRHAKAILSARLVCRERRIKRR